MSKSKIKNQINCLIVCPGTQTFDADGNEVSDTHRLIKKLFSRILEAYPNWRLNITTSSYSPSRLIEQVDKSHVIYVPKNWEKELECWLALLRASRGNRFDKRVDCVNPKKHKKPLHPDTLTEIVEEGAWGNAVMILCSDPDQVIKFMDTPGEFISKVRFFDWE